MGLIKIPREEGFTEKNNLGKMENLKLKVNKQSTVRRKMEEKLITQEDKILLKTCQKFSNHVINNEKKDQAELDFLIDCMQRSTLILQKQKQKLQLKKRELKKGKK